MIKVNELFLPFEENTTLFKLKERLKPNADITIYNGFPVAEDKVIEDGDEVVFIKRGETPGMEELEGLMTARHTPGVHLKLKKAVVGIAGLGGLGSSIAIALARIGIGKLVLVDFDVVEPSNLNRQQYFVHQIGEKKTDAMEENLNMVNPYVEIVVHNIKIDETNISTLFEGTQILVEAFDRPDYKAMLINSFLEHFPNRYVVSASGLAGYEDANLIETKQYGHLFVVGDRCSAAMPGNGLMAPRVGVAAHHQANKVVELILREEL